MSRNKMKKIVVLSFSLLISFSFLSQSKKKQIYILQGRLDSITNVLSNERNINDKKIFELNSKISNLEIQISNLNSNVNDLNEKLNLKNADLLEKQTKITELLVLIQNKSDSLSQLNAELTKLKPSIKVNTTGQVSQMGVYKTVKIGGQKWMSENLNVTYFRNGDPILQAKSEEEMWKAQENKQPAWCYYNFDPKNGKKYGKLYNWYAVNDPRGLAPVGWHIPSEKDYLILDSLLGKSEAGKKMKTTSGWKYQEDFELCQNCELWNAEYRSKKACSVCKDNRAIIKKTQKGNGNNLSGFSGLPGGGASCGNIIYNHYILGEDGFWWTSTSRLDSSTMSIAIRLSFSFEKLFFDAMWQGYGFSVRCISD